MLGATPLCCPERVTLSHSSLRQLGGCWIFTEHNRNTLRKQKPLLIRHYDLILLKKTLSPSPPIPLLGIPSRLDPRIANTPQRSFDCSALSSSFPITSRITALFKITHSLFHSPLPLSPIHCFFYLDFFFQGFCKCK